MVVNERLSRRRNLHVGALAALILTIADQSAAKITFFVEDLDKKLPVEEIAKARITKFSCIQKTDSKGVGEAPIGKATTEFALEQSLGSIVLLVKEDLHPLDRASFQSFLRDQAEQLGVDFSLYISDSNENWLFLNGKSVAFSRDEIATIIAIFPEFIEKSGIEKSVGVSE